MSPFLVIIVIVMSVMILIGSLYLLVYFQSEEDQNTAYAPKVAVVLGLFLTCLLVLMLPLDVGNRNVNGGFPMEVLWQVMYISVAAMCLGVVPFMMFYYEAWDPEGRNWQVWTAIKYEALTIVVVGTTLVIGWALGGSAYVPLDEYAYNGTLLDATAPSSCSTSACESDHTAASIKIGVTIAVYLVALVAFLGWLFFTVFVGVGLVALPMDLINDYAKRPVGIDLEEYAKQRMLLNERSKQLMEFAKKLGADAHRKRDSGSVKKFNRFKQAVYLVEKDWKRVRQSPGAPTAALPRRRTPCSNGRGLPLRAASHSGLARRRRALRLPWLPWLTRRLPWLPWLMRPLLAPARLDRSRSRTRSGAATRSCGAARRSWDFSAPSSPSRGTSTSSSTSSSPRRPIYSSMESSSRRGAADSIGGPLLSRLARAPAGLGAGWLGRPLLLAILPRSLAASLPSRPWPATHTEAIRSGRAPPQLDKAFSLFGTVAYGLFTFYLLACVLKGCMKVGLRFFWIPIHPMRIGGTLMNSFLFNVWLLLLCAVATVQFCYTAFQSYARLTAIELLLGVQVTPAVLRRLSRGSSATASQPDPNCAPSHEPQQPTPAAPECRP